ncbi:CotH kinase family protein [Anaerotignum faecicola]
MHVLKRYKAVLLSGLLVVVFCVAAYCAVGRADSAESHTYAEHIFQDDTVNEINIEIDEKDWQDMLDNPLEEEYHKANVTINGETVGNVAIRTKGNTSLTSVANSDSDRYSFKLDFDYYDNNGNYYGLKKLCLNNNYSDNSSMREYISYKIMGELGLDVPQCGYSNITVNGEEWGLYLAVEAIDETFLETHFDDATGDLYKPEGQDGTGADLVYDGDDISSYTGLNLKTNEDTSDGKEIIALMKALEDGENLEDLLDVESALKYIAANVALANFDSYLGNTTHNYYLYEEDGYFTVIPWDMNLAFGGFGGGEVDIYEPTSQSMGGFGGGDKRKDTQDNDAVTNATENTEAQADAKQQPQSPDNGNMQGGNQQQPPDNGNMQGGKQPSGGKQPQGMPSMGSGEKPLVTTLLENETYRSMYEGYLKEIAEKYFTQEYMTELVTKIHDLIAPYVQNDPTAFCTYEEFEKACSTDPTDQYSLVYYAVNMAESIENQLSGGEPTFNTSSMQGGGMGGGGKGGPDFGGEKPDMPSRTEQSETSETAEAQAMNLTAEADRTEQITDAQQNDRPIPPDQNGGQMGGQMDENERTGQQNGQADGQQSGQQGNPPDFGGGEKTPPGMPGQDNKSVSLSDCLPMIAVCGGVFVVGAVVLILFKRKKDLKPPKEHKTE